MKYGFILAVLMVLVVALAAGGQNATVVTAIDVPITNLVIHDSCTNEDVTYNGFFKMQSETFVDGSGGFHMRLHQTDAHVIGIGNTTFLPYALNASATTVDNISSSGFPFEALVSFTQKTIGLGPMPNEKITTFFHQTVNADGTTTVELDKGTATKCTGPQ